MEHEELPEFSREVKRFQKKYPSIIEDITTLMLVLVSVSGERGKHHNCLYKNEVVEVYKIRMTCSCLRSSVFRVIYIKNNQTQKIILVELYYKGEKELEDPSRWKNYVKNIK